MRRATGSVGAEVQGATDGVEHHQLGDTGRAFRSVRIDRMDVYRANCLPEPRSRAVFDSFSFKFAAGGDIVRTLVSVAWGGLG